MILVIVLCFASAAIISYLTLFGKGSGIENIKSGESIWVECNNPGCQAEYQMDKKKYWVSVQESLGPMSKNIPPIVCEKCGESALFRAEKCEKCGQIFFYGSSGDEYPDRCPCGYSKKEEKIRKRGAAARQED